MIQTKYKIKNRKELLKYHRTMETNHKVIKIGIQKLLEAHMVHLMKSTHQADYQFLL
jgi:hypothetical protein